MTAQELNKKFGKKIIFYRKMNKMTQSDFAEELGLSIKTISEIENGRTFVSAESLANLANILKIDVYKLFIPDEIEYDNAPEALVKYSNEVKESMERITKKYLIKLKR